MKEIQLHNESLNKLCTKYGVSVLYVFGSMATDNFHKTSDIDFLVGFSEINPLNYFDNYIDFKAELECLFKRKVDLLEIQTVKNPILKKSIDRNKIQIYGRENSKMAV
jgi:uncharacterized protein